MNRKSVSVLVGIANDDTLVFADGMFWYGETFHGATGYNMSLMSPSQINRMRGDVDDNELLYEAWKHAVQNNMTEDSLADYSEELQRTAIDEEGLLYYGDDPSFRFESNEIWNALTDEVRERVESVVGKRVDIEDDSSSDEWCEFSVSSCGRSVPAKHEMQLILDERLFDILALVDGDGEMDEETFEKLHAEFVERADKMFKEDEC